MSNDRRACQHLRRTIIIVGGVVLQASIKSFNSSVLEPFRCTDNN